MAGKKCPKCGKQTVFGKFVKECTKCDFSVELEILSGKGGKGKKCLACGKNMVDPKYNICWNSECNATYN